MAEPADAFAAGSVVDRWLERQCAEHLHLTGAQLFAAHRGDVLCDAAFGVDGTGTAVEPHHLSRVYRASKVVLADIAVALADDHRISLSAWLGDCLDGLPVAFRRATIGDLLCHQVALAHPSGFAAALLPVDDKFGHLLAALELALSFDDEPAYGEYAGWELLAHALEAQLWVPWHRLAADRLDDLGIDRAEVALTADAFRSAVRTGSVGVNVAVRDGRSLPLLGESSMSMAERLAGPGYGMASSARALGQILHGGATARPAELAPHVRGDVPCDPSYRRGLRFVDGLMAGPASLGLSDLWPIDLVGHTGLGGMTTVFGSPGMGVTVALHLNGLVDPAVGERYVRSFLTSALADDVRQAVGAPIAH